MCDHKNLRTVGDRLFCKDCKAELPLEFLTEGPKKEEDILIPASEVKIQDDPASEDDQKQTDPEIPAEDPVQTDPEAPAEDKKAEDDQKPAQEEQQPAENRPVSDEQTNPAPKKERAKTGRKPAKKGE